MPTSVTSTGVTFPDATTQTTAAAPSSYVGGRGQVFTSSGTFTVPTGVTSVAVTVLGGGGGGGNVNGGQASQTYGGGGGGGIATTPVGWTSNCIGGWFLPASGFFGGTGGTAQQQLNTNLAGCNASGGYGNGGGGAWRINGTNSGGSGNAGLVIVEY